VAQWNLLTNHGRVLLYIAHDPEARLRDIAANLDITERSVYRVINEMADAGYIVKEREGRRNRYQVQPRSPGPNAPDGEHSFGETLRELADTSCRARPRRPSFAA
jgi:DNA-binding transcriptional ArsR family regulator